jgi:DNA polymerase/3'-5' exonuclease PolX
MGTKVFPANVARAIATKIVEELRPACDYIEIAGSLRRGNLTVHDIDIVVLPKAVAQEFSLDGSTPLDGLLSQLIKRGSLTAVRGREKIKCFVATKTKVPVDIYIARPETWATLLLIRTGSKEHNIKLARRAKELGMKLRASGDGIEDSNGVLHRLSAEDQVFALLNLRYLPPNERT